MRLSGVVVKPTLGRLWLHHLRSTYSVEVNSAALGLLEAALQDPQCPGPGRALVQRLEARALVEDAPFAPLAVRGQSDLVSVELEPIGRCNLECGHCFVEFSQRQMTAEVFAAVLGGAQRLGAVELTFNGGEPLLHPSTLDWIDEVSAAGLRPLLFTNGTLVTERIAARLAKAQVAKVTISLDGFEETHDALRGPGAFRRTVKGIQHLVAAGVSVHTTTLVHPQNQKEVEALRLFCRESLKVSTTRTSTVAEIGRAKARPDLQLPQRAFEAVYGNERPRPARQTSGTLPCAAGVDKLYVTASGAVHGCHLFEGVAPPLGELGSRSLEELYRATESASAALFRAFRLSQLRHCRACAFATACMGGCRARAWKMTGDPFGVDPISCQRWGVAGADTPQA